MARVSRHSQRGSVAVMAMIMVLSSMAIAIVYVTLSGASRTKQTRQEAIRVVQAAFDGGVDYVRDMAGRGVLRMPQTVSVTIGNVSESLALTDISTTTVTLRGVLTINAGPPLILIDGKLSYNGQIYHLQKVIGRGALSTVWQYAIYDNSALSALLYSVTTTVPGYLGDAWFSGSLTLTNGGTHFGGDLTSTGTIAPPTMNVDGKMTENSPAISFPSLTRSNYQTASTLTVSSPLTGYTFPADTGSGYSIAYSGSNLSISGSFLGSGVIYVQGSVTITGDILTSSPDHLVILCEGNATISSSVNTVDAYIYCGGTLTINSGVNPLTTQGGVVANSISLSRNLSSGFDPTIRDNPVEAYRLKLPGIWP